MRRPGHRAYPLECAGWRRLGIGATTLGEAMAPSGLPPGLYALVKLSGHGGFEDVQLNAVLPANAWFRRIRLRSCGRPAVGRRPRGRAGEPQVRQPPQLIGVVSVAPRIPGFGRGYRRLPVRQRRDAEGKLFGGASDYPRDYLQAWLALANLRIPVFMVPGNHDGYRFEDVLGRTRADGLLLFENTFGPTYFSFDRPPYRFILISSYDLPGEHRASRRSGSSTPSS